MSASAANSRRPSRPGFSTSTLTVLLRGSTRRTWCMHCSVVAGFRPCVPDNMGQAQAATKTNTRVVRGPAASFPAGARRQTEASCITSDGATVLSRGPRPCVGHNPLGTHSVATLTSKCHHVVSSPPACPPASAKAATTPANSPAVISGRSLKLTMVRLPVAALRTM